MRSVVGNREPRPPREAVPKNEVAQRFAEQLDVDPARLILIDETLASTNMGRRYRRAQLAGQRTVQGSGGDEALAV